MTEPCKTCGCADDVTCEECEAMEKNSEPSMDIKEALICDSCTDANAYNCANCMEEKN